MGTFQENTIGHFLSSLIQKIENAFDIPHHLKGFTVIDPNSIPTIVEKFDRFGDE